MVLKEEELPLPLPFSSPGRGFLVVSEGWQHVHVRACALLVACTSGTDRSAPFMKTCLSHLRETLKPNTLSYSFMSFLSKVLFPAPDGPLSTTGLGPAIAEGEMETTAQKGKESGWKNWHIVTGILLAWIRKKPDLVVHIRTTLKTALLKPNITFTQALLRWDEHNKPAVLKVKVNDAQNNSHKSWGNQLAGKLWG